MTKATINMLDRKVAPVFQSIETLDFPAPEQITLSNNLPVYLLNYGSQEVLRLEWISHSGRISESLPGTSFFALKMLGEGTKELSSAQLQEIFQQYGAFLEFSNGFDHNVISIYTLSRHLEPILGLLKEMIMNPRMDPADLAVLKNIKSQEIKLNQGKNNVVASQLFRKALFGNQHPYGKSLEEKEVEAIDINQASSYHSQQLLSNSQLLVSGKIEAVHIDQITLAFSSVVFPKRKTLQKFPSITPSSIRQDLKDSLQTSIRYGKKFLKMTHPDFISMMVVNEILGGYFGSRLMKNIREDKGFTYGIYSNVLSLQEEGYFVIGADVIKENLPQTIEEIHKEIHLMQQELISTEELETVKNYMLGNLVSSMDTAFDIADKFKRVHLNGLNMDYYTQMVQTIHEIDPLTIQNLAKQYLQTDSLVLVTVG